MRLLAPAPSRGGVRVLAAAACALLVVLLAFVPSSVAADPVAAAAPAAPTAAHAGSVPPHQGVDAAFAKRSAEFTAFTSSCWSAPITSVCVGDLSTRPLPERDSNGFSLLSFPTPTPSVAGAPTSPVVGFWDFEDIYAQDGSAHNNPMSPVPPSGPGFLRGSSGLFTGRARYSIPHIAAYAALPSATISMWVYPLAEVHDGFRTLLHKGHPPHTAAAVNAGQRSSAVDAFSLKVWPDTRQLRLTVGGADTLDSRAALPLRRWTHIAIAIEAAAASLYVNGQLDGTVVFPATSPATTALTASAGPLFVASAPEGSLLGLHSYVDKLEWRAGVTPSAQIKAAATQALLGVPGGADFTWLGCEGCSHADATAACAQRVPVVGAANTAAGSGVDPAAEGPLRGIGKDSQEVARDAASAVETAKAEAAKAEAAKAASLVEAGASPAPAHPPSHLCTARELASSALLIARVMGYVPISHVPRSAIHDFENTSRNGPAVRGFGLCCLDE